MRDRERARVTHEPGELRIEGTVRQLAAYGSCAVRGPMAVTILVTDDRRLVVDFEDPTGPVGDSRAPVYPREPTELLEFLRARPDLYRQRLEEYARANSHPTVREFAKRHLSVDATGSAYKLVYEFLYSQLAALRPLPSPGGESVVGSEAHPKGAPVGPLPLGKGLTRLPLMRDVDPLVKLAMKSGLPISTKEIRLQILDSTASKAAISRVGTLFSTIRQQTARSGARWEKTYDGWIYHPSGVPP